MKHSAQECYRASWKKEEEEYYHDENVDDGEEELIRSIRPLAREMKCRERASTRSDVTIVLSAPPRYHGSRVYVSVSRTSQGPPRTS